MVPTATTTANRKHGSNGLWDALKLVGWRYDNRQRLYGLLPMRHLLYNKPNGGNGKSYRMISSIAAALSLEYNG